MRPLVRVSALALGLALGLVCFRAALIAYAVGQAANRTGLPNWHYYGPEPFPDLVLIAEWIAAAGLAGFVIAGMTKTIAYLAKRWREHAEGVQKLNEALNETQTLFAKARKSQRE